MMKRSCVFVLLAFCVALSVCDVNVYIDASAKGSNNDCSEEKPCSSLSEAFDSVSTFPGNLNVYIAEGTYSGSKVNCDCDFPSYPVSLYAMTDNNTVIFDGENTSGVPCFSPSSSLYIENIVVTRSYSAVESTSGVSVKLNGMTVDNCHYCAKFTSTPVTITNTYLGCGTALIMEGDFKGLSVKGSQFQSPVMIDSDSTSNSPMNFTNSYFYDTWVSVGDVSGMFDTCSFTSDHMLDQPLLTLGSDSSMSSYTIMNSVIANYDENNMNTGVQVGSSSSFTVNNTQFQKYLDSAIYFNGNTTQVSMDKVTFDIMGTAISYDKSQNIDDGSLKNIMFTRTSDTAASFMASSLMVDTISTTRNAGSLIFYSDSGMLNNVTISGMSTSSVIVKGIDSTKATWNISDSTFTGMGMDNPPRNGNGGGLSVMNANGFTVDNSTFKMNYASQIGGGIYVESVDSGTLTKVTLNNNTAGTEGGGLGTVKSGDVKLEDCTFENNYASVQGGAMHFHPHNEKNTSVIITIANDNQFITNYAQSAATASCCDFQPDDDDDDSDMGVTCFVELAVQGGFYQDGNENTNDLYKNTVTCDIHQDNLNFLIGMGAFGLGIIATVIVGGFLYYLRSKPSSDADEYTEIEDSDDEQ